MKTITIDPSGLNATTSLTYDVVGDVTQVTRPSGGYAAGNPIEYIDPDGQFGIIGGLVSAGVSFGFQVAENYYNNGGNLGAAVRCVNPRYVAIAFGIGLVFPGGLSVVSAGGAAMFGEGSFSTFASRTVLFGIGYDWKKYLDELSDITFGKGNLPSAGSHAY